MVVGSAGAIGDEARERRARVKLITFTGSGGVGWGLAEYARITKRVKKLELGNATSAIVCADAPEDTAAKLAANAFSFAGQSCIFGAADLRAGRSLGLRSSRGLRPPRRSG